jgi:predicted Holliday junction resolvase-like endonuclease
MSEEIIVAIVTGIGFLVEYIRNNRGQKALKTIELVERWATNAARASRGLRESGLIETDEELWEEWEKRIQNYARLANIKLSPKMRLLAGQRAADEMNSGAPTQSTTFDDLLE